MNFSEASIIIASISKMSSHAVNELQSSFDESNCRNACEFGIVDLKIKDSNHTRMLKEILNLFKKEKKLLTVF